MNLDLILALVLVACTLVVGFCTVVLATFNQPLVAGFTGLFTIALVIFSAYSLNVYRSNKTNMF